MQSSNINVMLLSNCNDYNNQIESHYSNLLIIICFSSDFAFSHMCSHVLISNQRDRIVCCANRLNDCALIHLKPHFTISHMPYCIIIIIVVYTVYFVLWKCINHVSLLIISQRWDVYKYKHISILYIM